MFFGRLLGSPQNLPCGGVTKSCRSRRAFTASACCRYHGHIERYTLVFSDCLRQVRQPLGERRGGTQREIGEGGGGTCCLDCMVLRLQACVM